MTPKWRNWNTGKKKMPATMLPTTWPRRSGQFERIRYAAHEFPLRIAYILGDNRMAWRGLVEESIEGILGQKMGRMGRCTELIPKYSFGIEINEVRSG